MFNLIPLAVFVWASYKAFTAEDKEGALFYIIVFCFPCILVLCGVHVDDIPQLDE